MKKRKQPSAGFAGNEEWPAEMETHFNQNKPDRTPLLSSALYSVLFGVKFHNLYVFMRRKALRCIQSRGRGSRCFFRLLMAYIFAVPSLSDEDDDDIVPDSDDSSLDGEGASGEASDGGSDASELLDARQADLDDTEREFMERAEKIRRQEEEEEAQRAWVDPRPQPGDPDWDPELFYDSDDSENEVCLLPSSRISRFFNQISFIS